MFSVILKKDIKTGNFFNRVKNYKNRKKFYITFEKMGESRFVNVLVENPQKVDWLDVSRSLGRSANNVIISEEIKDHIDFGLFKEVVSIEYSNILTKNTIKYILENAGDKTRNMKAVLVDIRGIYLDYAKIMVKYLGNLKICTNRLDLYEDFAEGILDEIGAAIIVTDRFENLYDSNLIVCPNSEVYKFESYTDVPIVAFNSPINRNQNIYHSFFAKTPPILDEALPNHINEHIFQAALYQVNHCDLLSKIIADGCIYKGSVVSLNSLIEKIFSC